MQTLKAMALSADAGLLLAGLALWVVIALGGDQITTVMFTSRDLHIMATVLVVMGGLNLYGMFTEPAARPDPPWAFSILIGAVLVLYVWTGRAEISALWITVLAVISALLIGGGLLGLWNSFPEPRSMSTVIRILLGALAIVLVFAAVHVATSILGIERGEWRYALAIGIGIALVHLAWSLLARKKQSPAKSS